MGGFAEEEAFGGGGAVDAAAGVFAGDAEEVLVGIVAEQAQLEPALAGGGAVAGAGVAAGLGEDGEDIGAEVPGCVGRLGCVPYGGGGGRVGAGGERSREGEGETGKMEWAWTGPGHGLDEGTIRGLRKPGMGAGWVVGRVDLGGGLRWRGGGT